MDITLGFIAGHAALFALCLILWPQKRIRVTLDPLASTVPEFNAVRTLPVYEHLQGVPRKLRNAN